MAQKNIFPEGFYFFHDSLRNVHISEVITTSKKQKQKIKNIVLIQSDTESKKLRQRKRQ